MGLFFKQRSSQAVKDTCLDSWGRESGPLGVPRQQHLQSSPTSGDLKPGGRQLLQWLPRRGLGEVGAREKRALTHQSVEERRKRETIVQVEN